MIKKDLDEKILFHETINIIGGMFFSAVFTVVFFFAVGRLYIEGTSILSTHALVENWRYFLEVFFFCSLWGAAINIVRIIKLAYKK